jgi:hypothetical protein
MKPAFHTNTSSRQTHYFLNNDRLFLVTGGAGFVGSHIAETLLGRGHQVRIVDNLVTVQVRKMSQILATMLTSLKATCQIRLWLRMPSQMQPLRSRQACLCGIVIAKVAFHRKAKSLTKRCEFRSVRAWGPVYWQGGTSIL